MVMALYDIYNQCNNLNQNETEYYVNQKNDPKLIIGDFNAHHTSWNLKLNLKHTNKKAKVYFKQ